jgi:hypothetical protein
LIQDWQILVWSVPLMLWGWLFIVAVVDRAWLRAAFAAFPLVVLMFIVYIEAQLARLEQQEQASLAECEGVPKVIPYREGMTLCPGQSAIITIVIPTVPDGRDI